jgi:hypothetical protein
MLASCCAVVVVLAVLCELFNSRSFYIEVLSTSPRREGSIGQCKIGKLRPTAPLLSSVRFREPVGCWRPRYATCVGMQTSSGSG